MEQRLGICSLCGGEVYGHLGPWWGLVPPPPATCRSCGGVQAGSIIPMVPRGPRAICDLTTTSGTGG